MDSNVNATAYKHQRADGLATELAIGKATAPSAYLKREPRLLFQYSNTSRKTQLKADDIHLLQGVAVLICFPSSIKQ